MSRYINGNGPRPCEFFICGEGPGYQEAAAGRVFVGKTGEELSRHLDGVNCPRREDCFLTNIFREYKGKDYVWAQQDLADSEPYLLRELAACRPKIIVPLGRYATRFFMGDVDMDEVFGIPWIIDLCQCGKPIHSQDSFQKYPSSHRGAGTTAETLLPDTDTSGSMGEIGKPTESLTNYSSGQSARGTTSIISAETEHASTQRMLSLLLPQKTSGAGIKLAHPVSQGTHSRRKIRTSGPVQRDQDVSAVPVSNNDPATGKRCTCGAVDASHEVICHPIHHPAAGFHNSEMAGYVVAGFRRLGEFLDGQIPARRLYDDPFTDKEQYEEITDPAQIILEPKKPVSVDTEGWPDRPWSLQYSQEAGRAYLIRAANRSALEQFSRVLIRDRIPATFHSALHDLAMMRALGIPYHGKFDDTMVMAYLLQLEPQGLKALCARHCNMRMQSYEELVAEPDERLAIGYLTWLWDAEQEKYEDRRKEEFDRLCSTPYVDARGIQKSGRRLKVLPRIPKTALHKAVTRCLQSKNHRKLWGDQIEDIRVAGYNRLGEMPIATLDYVPADRAIRYGCRDSDGTTRVREELSTRIDALQLREIYDLELGTYPLIDRMQQIGIKPDLDHFGRLSKLLHGELGRLREELTKCTGDSEFNANSGDQVAAYLFDTLGLEGMKRTSEGRFSTNDKILETLEKEHGAIYPVISDIRAYRGTYKLKNTFVDRLPDFVQRWPFDGRIHASFRTTRVVTGRLAASDPNLLAMPKHGKFATDFRRGWVPEPGHILCEWDLSQIELRVLAHLSQDPILLEAFCTGQDLHAGLAQRIFGGSLEDHKKGSTRLAAKAINFGIPMGMTSVGLSMELRKNGVQADEDDAQRWLDETMALYKLVPEYQTQKAAEAARNGFVRCLSGRIRYIGGIRSRDERIREEAKRFAFSTPIQEGAQWIMKIAEASLYQDILVPYWKQGQWVEPLIQIHDALTLECAEDWDLALDLNTKMQAVMTRAPVGFSVPIETSGDWGWNWADMEPFTILEDK